MEALALRSPAESVPAVEPMSDVARAAAGDARAFEALYRTHLPRVHSLVRRMTAGRDADELTQDVFVRLWQKLGTFRGDSSFSTWLHRLAVNVVIERFRTDAIEGLDGAEQCRPRSDDPFNGAPGQLLDGKAPGDGVERIVSRQLHARLGRFDRQHLIFEDKARRQKLLHRAIDSPRLDCDQRHLEQFAQSCGQAMFIHFARIEDLTCP